MRTTTRQTCFVRVTKGSAFLDDRLSLSSPNILERATTWLGLLLIKLLRAARSATIDFDMRFMHAGYLESDYPGGIIDTYTVSNT